MIKASSMAKDHSWVEAPDNNPDIDIVIIKRPRERRRARQLATKYNDTVLMHIILERRLEIGNGIERSLEEMVAANIYTKYKAKAKRNLDHIYLTLASNKLCHGEFASASRYGYQFLARSSLFILTMFSRAPAHGFRLPALNSR